MKRALVLSLMCSNLFSASYAQDDIAAEALIGEWAVDLYYSPTAEPSKTEMVIKSLKDGGLVGTFYQSEFEKSGYTVFEDEVLFTVQTSDGSGPYLTSGRLNGECINGQTLSTGRDFLMAWKACRKIDAE